MHELNVMFKSDDAKSRVESWYFKHISDAQRIMLIAMFTGTRIASEANTQAVQGQYLNKIFDWITGDKLSFADMQNSYAKQSDKVRKLEDPQAGLQNEIGALRHHNDLLFKCLSLALQNNELGASAERLLSAVDTYEQMGKSINGLDKAINSVGKES